MKKLLELKDISMKYQTQKDEITAIKNLNMECGEGEFLSLIGPSGCGKTTVLSIIAGLIKPTGGEVLIDGTPIRKHSAELGYMLQKDLLVPWSTI